MYANQSESGVGRGLGMHDSIGTRNLIFIPGPLMTDGRGKIDGIIVSRNKGGLYMKSFANPVNPNTVRQQDVREDFAVLVSDWGARLTTSERQSWRDYAAATPVQNKLGQPIFLTGQNWFIKINTLLLQAGLTVTDVAPPLAISVPPDSSFQVSGVEASVPGPGTIEIAFNNAEPWANTDGSAMLVYMGQPQGPGVENFNVQYRLAGAILGNSTTPPTDPADFNAPWEGIVSGIKVTAKATIIEAVGTESPSMQSPYFEF